jgi:hypothetical protein
MQQQLGAIVEPQRHCVRAVGDRQNLARRRRAQQALDRIDREAVAHHPLGEDCVGHCLERREPAGEGRNDCDGIGVHITHGTNSTASIAQSGSTPLAV